MKVCIDAGHVGKDAGAVIGKRYEKNDNLEMALKLQNLLQQQGVTVVMTRETDKDVTLAQRTSLANKEKCNLFLSLHRDSFPNAYGATVYVYSNANAKTYDYGKAILDAVVNSGGFASRGVRKGAPNYKDFAVNRDTSMPACLLELGFISSALDNSTYDRKKDDIAKALCRAICKQLGVVYIDKSKRTEYKPSIKEFQTAASKDGYKFPLFGADGAWGDETAGVAQSAILRRSPVYRNKNLTALVQKVIGVKVDGLYGKDTEKAVKEYQVKYGLTPDGIVGINTYQKILCVK